MTIIIRPVERRDYVNWRPLWDGYNAFYGRTGPTALDDKVTARTWERFFASNEPVHAFVAEKDDGLIGTVHYLFHRSTTRFDDVCYLQDLFTAPDCRGQGIGRRLIEAVYDSAEKAGSSRVYWQTHETNAAGRLLYDKVGENKGFIVYGRDL